MNNIPHTPNPQSSANVPPSASSSGSAAGVQCGRCAYDLAGLSAKGGQVKCPECGTNAQIPPEGVPFSVVCVAEDGSLFRRAIVATTHEAAARLAREWGLTLAASDLRAPPMCCRRCHYVLTGLEVSGPDCTVKCPECGTLSTVPQQLLSEAYLDPEPGIILKGYSPGAALAVVGIIFALLGIWYTYLAFAAIALGAFACDRSAGRRGWFAMGLGASVFLIMLVYRAILAPSSP